MAFVHAKDTFVSLNGSDLSLYTNTSQLDQESDEHDLTCYGADDYVVDGGLLKGAFSMGGRYFSTAAGPKAIIEPLIGTVVTLIFRPEGTGSGKPQSSVSVLVKKYTQTQPVADFINWNLDMTKSGAITRSTQ